MVDQTQLTDARPGEIGGGGGSESAQSDHDHAAVGDQGLPRFANGGHDYLPRIARVGAHRSRPQVTRG